MLKKLDRYIVGKFLSTFLYVSLIFTQIAIVIDFSEKVEEFIDEQVAISEIIFDYYINFILWINGLLWPLYALIAVIFFTSRLAYNSEIISVLSAGVSFRRLMRPYLIGACTIAFFHLLGNHFLIPYGNKSKLDFENAYVWKESERGKTRDIHMFIRPEEKVYVRFYKKKDSTALDIRLERFQDNQLVYMLKARKAEWIEPPYYWKLQNYEIREFDGMQEEIYLGKGESMDTIIHMTPQDFIYYDNQKERMLTPELKAEIAKEQSRGLNNTKTYFIEIYRRWADSITIIILTLIGLAVASRKVRGGMGLHLAIGIAIGAIFIFLTRFSQTFAMSPTFPAWLGVWLPNIIFGSIALYLISRAQK